MYIKIFILIISSLLLFDEYFYFTKKVKKKIRKRIVLGVLVFLSILSFVDLYFEKRGNDELVQTAKDIVNKQDTLNTKTDSILIDLEKNLVSVEKTSQNIFKIDSVLKNVNDSIANQVELLNKAVKKSKELVKLEELQFKQDEAKLIFYNKNILFKKNEKDSSYYELELNCQNKGKRKAVEVSIKFKLLFFDKIHSKYEITDTERFIRYNLDIEVTSAHISKTEKLHKAEKNRYNYNSIILIIKCDYLDELTNSKKSYHRFYEIKQKKDLSFIVSTIEVIGDVRRVNEKLIEYNLNEFIIK